MSERRPHWDDELIFAVMSAAGDGGHLFIDDIHAVIAAVEDWQRQRGPSLTEFIEMDDAIKRVRDVTVPVPGDVYDLDSYTRGAADALALTNKALDGGSSTVLPPLPSTPLDQNPVCPACGGTLALERNRVVCLSDEVNHYWYWDGSDDSPNCGVCDEQWPCAASAEAAIARVRQVLDEEQRGYNPPLGLISRIKTALEGDSDD